MFEMLGVLAIVGLLSIAGLYGYTTAMNRHRANELLDEALKRATIVAGQLLGGNEVPEEASDDMIREFTDSSSAHTFKVKKKNDDQFYMEIYGVSKKVCELMENALGSAVRDITCPEEEEGLATLTFNNDMSTNSKPGDNDGDQTACETAGNQYCESIDKCIGPEETCPVGTNLSCPDFASNATGEGWQGAAFTVTETEGTGSITCYCPTGQGYNGTDCSSPCVISGTCTDNSTVCPGYYCAEVGGDWTNDSETGLKGCGDSTFMPGSGTVRPLGEVEQEGTYLWRPSYETWVGAVNFCSALKVAIDMGMEGYKNYTLKYGRLPTLPDSCFTSLTSLFLGEVATSEGPCPSFVDLPYAFWANNLFTISCADTSVLMKGTAFVVYFFPDLRRIVTAPSDDSYPLCE